MLKFRTYLLIFIMFLGTLISTFLVSKIYASEEDDLLRKIQEYENQLKEIQTKSNTLSNQIAQFNTQISLTILKITQTQEQITLLTSRIDQLGSSLDNLSKAYTGRVVETYKMSRANNPTFLILSSVDLTDALSKYQYLKLAQESDHGLLARLTKAQSGYQDQKKELEILNDTLSKQKKTLDSQKQAKAKLLSITQNDEKKYQALLSEARRQLAAFKSFTQGATILSNQTKCDSWGCYYNQRDSEWATKNIGSSSENMKDVGCLITSMAMIATHYGKSLKPSDIAGSTAPFAVYSPAYMNLGSWTVNGVTMNRTRLGSSPSLMDGELSANRPVIVGIDYNGDRSSDHFIVIKKKEGDSYIMNDPFVENGHDIKLTDKYSLSSISVVDRVSVN